VMKKRPNPTVRLSESQAESFARIEKERNASNYELCFCFDSSAGA
jgi:hypothetical protein